MGERATIGYTDAEGKQRTIHVPASGDVVPKNTTEEQVLRSFEDTDVLRGNTLRPVGFEREQRKSSSKRSSSRRATPATPAETPAERPAETEG
jgi:hypothetical protein